MREAASLQDDLNRAGIKPYAWLINQSLSMHSGISDLLKSRANAEIEVIIKTIKTKYADRTFDSIYCRKKITSSIVRRTFKQSNNLTC
jgi:arsenite-transporting ATPase